MATAELVLDAKAKLGEGPFWHGRERVLYWVDIESKILNIFDPRDRTNRRIHLPSRVGTAAPTRGRDILVALEDGIYRLDPESEALSKIVDPEPDRTDNRFNDGKCSPEGRFWAGTMSLERKIGAANLYCLHPDGRIEKKLTDITTSNGLAWSADGTTMYYIDTKKQNVRAFDYDPATGNIANERVIIEVPDEMGHPDGMTIDSEGTLWVALFYGGGVSRWDPVTGTLIEKYDVGAKNVTACTFGGDDLSTLYITTARAGTSDEELRHYPSAGGVFALEPGVSGKPAFEFAG